MPKERQYYIYILASQKNGTLYTGVTGNLFKRVRQHKANVVEGFTKKYGVHYLIYFERFRDVNVAITREKQIKAWQRQWKIDLIGKCNPDWDDLYKNENAIGSFLQKQGEMFAAKIK
ncbi:MAG: GIY-YIG nuclease family protein [Planctomycetes bacterium]|nr:GIY-YIG nuclease family protein [Planctomycetota bacterium]